MAGQVGSAVVSELTNRAISKVISKVIGMVDKQGAVDEKLCKLENLCTKIKSAVKESEEHKINGTYLLKWQEKLREAGAQGDDVIFGFQWRALNGASKSSNHQIGTHGALTYTKILVSNIVNYFHSAIKMLLSSNEDVQKLNSMVEMLEKLSADNEEFSTLVELEVLMREEKAPAKVEKPEILEKLSIDNEELPKLVVLENLTRECAPTKGKKPEILEKPSADNQEIPSADNQEISRLIELDVSTEEHAPAKGKKPVVICDRSLSHKEVHQHSNRKRALDSIIESTKMIGSMKRAASLR